MSQHYPQCISHCVTALEAIYQITRGFLWSRKKALCYIFKYGTVLLKTSRSKHFNVLNWWSYPLTTDGRRDYTHENSAASPSCVCGPWAAVFSFNSSTIFCALSLCLLSSRGLLWEFMPPLHILSLSYLSRYLYSLSPSNCFSTASLAEERQLFKIQLTVQLLSGGRISKSNSQPTHAQTSPLQFGRFLVGRCVCFCLLWSGQRPRDRFLSLGPMSNQSPNLPRHLSLAAQQGHRAPGPQVSWG